MNQIDWCGASCSRLAIDSGDHGESIIAFEEQNHDIYAMPINSRAIRESRAYNAIYFDRSIDLRKIAEI